MKAAVISGIKQIEIYKINFDLQFDKSKLTTILFTEEVEKLKKR